MNASRQPISRVEPSLAHVTRRGLVRSHHVNRNMLLDVTITWRMTLGFVAAALVAVIAASIVGIQREQSLSRQSDFYQNLLQVNTLLNTGSEYLLLMDTEIHAMLSDASVQAPSQETLHTDQNAIEALAARYNAIAAEYVQHDLLTQHSDEVSLLNEGGHASLVSQQQSLVGSTLRTWQIFRAAQDVVLEDIITGSLVDARSLLRTQDEPTNADALSALRALLRFDQRLSASVHDAASVEEQNQNITTIVAALCAFIVIAFTGWLISNTLVQRLRQLRRVTQAVEQGQLDSRVRVIGHDEIAGVSVSVNDMLDTIVGLLEETERQRDALTNAATHLFSDMRVVNAGDLRVHALETDDAIGMLANAFNFTVGRFNHFVLRTQMTMEQLDVLARQQGKRIEGFKLALDSHVQTPDTTSLFSSPSIPAVPGTSGLPAAANPSGRSNTQPRGASAFLVQAQVQRSREQIVRVAQECTQQLYTLQKVNEQVYQAAHRVRQLIQSNMRQVPGSSLNSQANQFQTQTQELQALETSLVKLHAGWQQLEDGLMKELTRLDTTLKVLVSSSAQKRDTDFVLPSGSRETMAYSQEFTSIARSFAQEMFTFTQRLMNIIQEMRTTATSFRPDSAEARNVSQPTTPYVPMHENAATPQRR